LLCETCVDELAGNAEHLPVAVLRYTGWQQEHRGAPWDSVSARAARRPPQIFADVIALGGGVGRYLPDPRRLTSLRRQTGVQH
jgi:hypothetical protein